MAPLHGGRNKCARLRHMPGVRFIAGFSLRAIFRADLGGEANDEKAGIRLRTLLHPLTGGSFDFRLWFLQPRLPLMQGRKDKKKKMPIIRQRPLRSLRHPLLPPMKSTTTSEKCWPGFKWAMWK